MLTKNRVRSLAELDALSECVMLRHLRFGCPRLFYVDCPNTQLCLVYEEVYVPLQQPATSAPHPLPLAVLPGASGQVTGQYP